MHVQGIEWTLLYNMAQFARPYANFEPTLPFSIFLETVMCKDFEKKGDNACYGPSSPSQTV